MSGYGGPDLQAQAQAAGAQSVLAKPLAAADLAQCLAAVFGRAATRAPQASLPSTSAA